MCLPIDAIILWRSYKHWTRLLRSCSSPSIAAVSFPHGLLSPAMPPFNVVLQILSAILTAYVALLIFRHSRNGPERRRELTVLAGALAACIFAVATPIATRLDTIVDGKTLLSRTTQALADSLGWSPAEQRRQSTREDLVLTGLRVGAARQSAQIRDQQELLRAQEALNAKTLRQSFPLETPIGVYGEIEYPADSVGIGAFMDSVTAWSRMALQRTPCSKLARFPDENGVVRGEIRVDRGFDAVKAYVERTKPDVAGLVNALVRVEQEYRHVRNAGGIKKQLSHA